MPAQDVPKTELRERLVAALQRALTAEASRSRWAPLVADLAAELARVPLRRLVDREQLSVALRCSLERANLERTTLPVVRQLARLMLGRLQLRPEPAQWHAGELRREVGDEGRPSRALGSRSSWRATTSSRRLWCGSSRKIRPSKA
jgi:hypothetical protein